RDIHRRESKENSRIPQGAVQKGAGGFHDRRREPREQECGLGRGRPGAAQEKRHRGSEGQPRGAANCPAESSGGRRSNLHRRNARVPFAAEGIRSRIREPFGKLCQWPRSYKRTRKLLEPVEARSEWNLRCC